MPGDRNREPYNLRSWNASFNADGISEEQEQDIAEEEAAARRLQDAVHTRHNAEQLENERAREINNAVDALIGERPVGTSEDDAREQLRAAVQRIQEIEARANQTGQPEPEQHTSGQDWEILNPDPMIIHGATTGSTSTGTSNIQAVEPDTLEEAYEDLVGEVHDFAVQPSNADDPVDSLPLGEVEAPPQTTDSMSSLNSYRGEIRQAHREARRALRQPRNPMGATMPESLLQDSNKRQPRLLAGVTKRGQLMFVCYEKGGNFQYLSDCCDKSVQAWLVRKCPPHIAKRLIEFKDSEDADDNRYKAWEYILEAGFMLRQL